MSKEAKKRGMQVEMRLKHVLEANARWRDPQQEPRNTLRWLPILQRWQSERLAESFSDFTANPDTSMATTFFLSDLYGDHDVSARDRGIERMVPMMKRVLPVELLDTVADAMELAVLSHAFDLKMADALNQIGGRRKTLDETLYAEAYRSVGLPRMRQRQIDLIVRVGEALDAAVRKPWLAKVLKISRLPARAAGLMDLQSFLERGFAAFAHMKDARGFMAEIARREGEVSRRLLAGHESPFLI